jgi:hypothetical protein
VLDTKSGTRKPPRGVVAHLSPEELSAHMRDVAQKRALYSEVGKAVVTALVERSRREQGLSPHVEDASALKKVADLVAGAT